MLLVTAMLRVRSCTAHKVHCHALLLPLHVPQHCAIARGLLLTIKSYMEIAWVGDKDGMMEGILDRKVRQYQVTEYEKGQRATDYTTWLTSSAHYNAKFEEVCCMLPMCMLANICY